MKTIYKISVIMVLIVSFIPVGTDQSYALSCAPTRFTEAFAGHDLLLHGTLAKKEIVSTDYTHQVMATLTFDTIKVYKGEHRETFTIRADLSWDDYYREGAQYVLFADKDGDDYVRDLCIGDYVASPSIIEFLDGYPLNMAVGIGVYSLYDLVNGFERDNLDILMARYSTLNRGDEAIRNIAQSGGDFSYTCDFLTDLKESSRYLANVTIVRNFNEQNPNSTITFEYDLESNPPVATVNYEGQNERAQVFVMNAKDLGNCFAVYNSKLIDKTTGEILREHNNFKTMCGAQNSHVLLPDLCPYTEDHTTTISSNGITVIGVLYTLIIGVAVGIPAYVIYKKKRK